jgi:hypothetical protein
MLFKYIVMSEYWIIGDNLEACDGDFNSPDHEMYVILHLLSEISDSLIGNSSLAIIGEIISEYTDDPRIDVDEVRARIMDAVGVHDSDRLYRIISDNVEFDFDTVAMVFGARTSDPRLWACKNLGWIRVVDDYIESWGLRTGMMKRAAWALYEIDEDPSHVWYWENRRNGRILHLTTEQIENGILSESIISRISVMITDDPDVFLDDSNCL